MKVYRRLEHFQEKWKHFSAGRCGKARNSGRASGVSRIQYTLIPAVLFFLAVLCQTGTAWAQVPLPQLVGRVVDNAAILDSATKAQLTATLAVWEQKTGDQLVVVTVPSLGFEDIESFANRLFRQWALGQARVNNGVLLVVAPNDRQVRIEVGYGLEGTLTDALSFVIINTWMLPAFRDGDYNKGVREGVGAIFSVLEGDSAGVEDRARAARAAAAKAAEQEEMIENIMGFVVFAIVFLIIVMPVLASVFGKKVGPNRYLWLGIVFTIGAAGGGFGGGGFGGGGFGGGMGGGGFGGGGGSSGGGGASGRW
ncbi:MAG: Hypothetical protein BHV28_12770 [Candidatus Tokpelaia hoelldobleri]|uniref:TPM domain-containing protein n=1 Tax=Candidatus Tokpelaia hoelldobleri TaxID=1902579 RepID=A0A1U9JVU5_9HYPH|nr:MAG: Hypothetical protein BHV28_12770 [Candidatus Tokpelaia hoelldoblerii]